MTSSEHHSALPGWLGPVATLTTQVGVPTMVAAVLLWFVLFRMDTTLRIIESAESDRVKIIATMQESVLNALDRQTQATVQAMRDNVTANQAIAAEMKEHNRLTVEYHRHGKLSP